MATGIVLMILGAFVLLRTVAPGQDRSLVDLIAPKKQDGAGGEDADDDKDKVRKINPKTLPNAIQGIRDAFDFPPLSPTPPPYRAPRGGRPSDNLAGHTGRR